MKHGTPDSEDIFMYPHGGISNNIYHRGMHNIHLKLILLYNKTPQIQ